MKTNCKKTITIKDAILEPTIKLTCSLEEDHKEDYHRSYVHLPGDGKLPRTQDNWLFFFNWTEKQEDKKNENS